MYIYTHSYSQKQALLTRVIPLISAELPHRDCLCMQAFGEWGPQFAKLFGMKGAIQKQIFLIKWFEVEG